jgi:membrane-bound metal-dependent hydrolase YbcI (DUF457 family)
MDPISHVVFGSSVVHLRPTLAARGTALAIALGALAPDLDFLMMPWGFDRYLVVHEAGTHSLIGATICGMLAALLAGIIMRRGIYRPLMLVSVIAAWTHVAADLLASAAIRVGWPLVDTRVGNLGVVSMGDLYMVTLLAVGGAVMWVWKSRRRQCAIALLCACAVLVAVKTISRERAERAYRAQPTAVADYLVEAVWGSLTSWRIFDRTDDAVRAWTVDASGTVRLDTRVLRAGVAAARLEESLQWETVRNFTRAHDMTFVVSSGGSVLWSDVRYCAPSDGNGVPECAIWAGGRKEPDGKLTLIASVGDYQTR